MARTIPLLLVTCLLSTASADEPLWSQLKGQFKTKPLSVGLLFQGVADFQPERSLPGENGFQVANFRLSVRGELDSGTAVKYTVLTVGVVSALGQVGINTGSLLASLGIAGLTIGFAARDALSNIISGIFIFWDRPFVIGDLIEVNSQYGRVDRITLRSTRVVTVDGRMLAIPNAAMPIGGLACLPGGVGRSAWPAGHGHRRGAHNCAE